MYTLYSEMSVISNSLQENIKTTYHFLSHSAIYDRIKNSFSLNLFK